jgi:aryl-alcohol dehydrogenase-like predicted oxidoreductase
LSSIPTRPFGKTGEQVSILSLGGGHIGRSGLDASLAVRILEQAIDEGITFFDNAWEYNDGESELRMGKALRGRRDRVFLMTKVCARDRAGAERQLEESLRRLGTDHVDLWQFHEVNYGNDPEWIFAPGGAAEAAEAALRSGKARFIGVTGHKDPAYLLEVVRQDFPLSAVQMPVNVLDAGFHKSFQKQLLPELEKRGIAAIGMKSLGGDGQFVREAKLSAAECIRYALSQPIASLVSGIDSLEILEHNVGVARGFEPMSPAEQEDFRRRTRAIADDGRYEWFKTTPYFDSKFHRDQHGFPEKLVRW